jgi:hypothetical protein
MQVFDPETGSHQTLADANPAGWTNVEQEDAAGRWTTFIGMDVIPSGWVACDGSRGACRVTALGLTAAAVGPAGSQRWGLQRQPWGL